MTDSLDGATTSDNLGAPFSSSGDPDAPAPPGASEPPATDGTQGGAEVLEDLVPDDLVCPECAAEGRQFQASSVRGYKTHRTRAHSPEGPAAGVGGEAAAAPGETVPGEPPKPARRSLKEWIAAKRAGDEGTKPSKPKRAFGTKGPREPLDEPIGWAYAALGKAVAQSGSKYVPVGRVMQMQSGAVGTIGDAALKGSILDRVAQPLLREGKQYKELAETVALPVATAMVIANPDMLGITIDDQGRIFATGWAWQAYYSLWETCAVQMAQGYERVEAKRRDIAEDLAKIPFLAPIIEAGQDPIVYMIVDVLGITPTPAGPGSDEAPMDTTAAAVP